MRALFLRFGRRKESQAPAAVPLGDHDLRVVLSRADEGDGTKVRVQKGRRLDRPAFNMFMR